MAPSDNPLVFRQSALEYVDHDALDMPRTNGLLYEYACHERNYGMESLLRGARVQEREGAGQ